MAEQDVDVYGRADTYCRKLVGMNMDMQQGCKHQASLDNTYVHASIRSSTGRCELCKSFKAVWVQLRNKPSTAE